MCSMNSNKRGVSLWRSHKGKEIGLSEFGPLVRSLTEENLRGGEVFSRNNHIVFILKAFRRLPVGQTKDVRQTTRIHPGIGFECAA